MDTSELQKLYDSFDGPKEYFLDEQDARIFKHLLSNNIFANEFVQSFDENIFTNNTSRKFAKAILSYIKIYKNAPTARILTEKIQDHPDLIEEFNFVFDKVNDTKVDNKELSYDLDKIKSKSIVYSTESFKKEMLKTEIKTPEDALALYKSTEKYTEQVKQITKIEKSATCQISLKNYLPEFKNYYNQKFNNPDYGRGVLTGYTFIDNLTNGVNPSDLIIVGASSGGGKSLFLCNLAYQLYLGKNKITNKNPNEFPGSDILYISLEMPVDQLVRRVMARMADVPNYGLRDASLKKEEFEAVQIASTFIEGYNHSLTIVDIPRGCTVGTIEKIYQSMEVKPKVVIVDYLSLLDCSAQFQNESDWLRLGYISGELHEFGRMHNVAIVTAAQLNRPPQNKSADTDNVGLHRFGRSSLILHHATLGLMIENRQDEHTFSDMLFHVVKNRNGALGSFTLNKKLSHSSITDLDMTFAPDLYSKIYLPNEITDISRLLEEFKW